MAAKMSPRSPPVNKCPTVGGRADGGNFLSSYVHLLKPRNSMSITNTKGLLNMPGQNNCFLNSAVQVLWHLDIFRRSFRELGGHACMEDSCIFCALKELFAQFQYSQESALPPDALRRALAETFCDQRRFQLGFMDDAAECFENILMRIHFHIANNESEDMCSAVHCIPHQKFAMTLVEQTVCHACGATSEPLPFTQMVHYVPSSALCSQAKLMKEKNEPIPSFSELLKRAGGLGDLRDCPSSCGAVIQIRKTLMNRPEIVSVGLVWDSERPTIEHIMDVFKTIGMSLKLQDVFHSVVDSRWASTATHQLVGIVTYYGKHYSTFFFHTKLRVWIYFDDAAVREIGPKWEQVVEKCCKGHFQPLLLLYANPHGTPVNTSSAPRIVTVVPGHKKNLNGKDICSGNLNHEKHARMLQHQNNQRRALTPNPEMSTDLSANLQPRRAVTPSGELIWWDESMKEQNGKKQESNPLHNTSKDNTTLPLPHTDAYSKFTCFPKNPDVDHSNLGSNTIDCSNSLKNRLAARLSVPHLSFYHALRQSKSGVVDSGLNNQPTEDNVKSLLESGISFNPAPDSSSMDSTYISRQAVENVLQLQKLQRQRSMNNKNENPFVGQRNSSSSLESLDNVFAKGLAPHLNILDPTNVARRRDSGNWSGDRNSASSSSTTSLDNPYFFVLGNKRYPNARNAGRPGDTPSLTDAGYDSFSLSSSDSYPSAINNSPGKLDSRLGQIPEHVQTAFVPYDISQLQYCLKELKNNDQFPFGFKDECDKLCAEADIFVAKSVERENVGDISMAALLSDTAAAKARAAMDVPYTNSQALAMAKMKHSMCLIRSSNLHKKLKEAETVLRRMQKESLAEASRKDPSANRTSAESVVVFPKEESENKIEDNSKHSKKSPKHSDESPKNDKNIEIYATLPKRSLKKKGALSSFVESLTGDESSEEKHKSSDEVRSSPTKKYDGNSSLSDRDEKSVKSPKGKKKTQSLHRTQNKDSDLSDYSNEWEQTKKTALYRTYSGPTSKSELSDMNPSGNQTFSDHPNKKQHRIRRKLMGGFMRRKNRSLPDLREGQDSGNETTRSYDDCFFTQIPTSCKKKQGNGTSPGNSSEGNTVEQPNNINTKVDKLHKKNINRTQTPPPYKPPPPITHSNLALNSSPKKPPQVGNTDHTKPNSQFKYPPSMRIQQENVMLQQQKMTHHPVSRDLKPQQKLSAQQSSDFTAGSVVWLKELQLKQEEMNRRRKQEEERKRWISECTSAVDSSNAGPTKKECVRDIAPSNQTILNVDGTHHSTQSLPKLTYINHKGGSMSDLENQKSVRDLTSKFETISFPTSASIEAFPEDKGRNLVPSSPYTSQEFYKPTESSINNETELHRYPLSMNFSSPPQDLAAKPAENPNKNAIGDSKDRSFSHKMPYTTQATAGSLYNPHLTDAQLTNVLRIGTNRSSFRNSSSNTDGHEDSIGHHTRDSWGVHDHRRPHKPPDYETALQRLEFLRHDRGLSKLYCSRGINFEAILEQAKKRRGPKKSVTFSDKVVLVACAGDEDNDFIPNPLLERVYKQHFMQKPNVPEPTSQMNNECTPCPKIVKEGSVTDTPQSTNDSKVTDFAKSPQSPCNLCHKKTIESSKLYCPDCAYYMSRFQQK